MGQVFIATIILRLGHRVLYIHSGCRHATYRRCHIL